MSRAVTRDACVNDVTSRATCFSGRTGKQELTGAKRCRRMLHYDDFYAQARLKRRRSRAVKRGFRLPSRVKLARAEALVRERMQLLDTELAQLEVSQCACACRHRTRPARGQCACVRVNTELAQLEVSARVGGVVRVGNARTAAL